MDENMIEETVTEENKNQENMDKEADKKENVVLEIPKETKVNSSVPPVIRKVKGFMGCKFILSLMMIMFTVIAGATLMIDMFIMSYEQSAVNAQSYVEYIKGTDIFYMINYFGDFSVDEKIFVITAIVCMIVTIGIGIVQFFLIMLWRSKAGYVVIMFTSVMAIASEGIMVCVFLEKYVHSQYDAMGMVGYGPVIAIAAHVFSIMLACVTRKLTKINSIVNP